MEIKYQEHNIDEVFRCFVAGFELKPGEKLWDWRAYYDPRAGKVIFKLLYVESKGETQGPP